MIQDEKKRAAAERAVTLLPKGEYIGVGTGSTVNYFIEALATIKEDICGAVSTSQASTVLLQKIGIPVLTLAETGRLPVYVDGADEINHSLHMIKGGGGALLAEKVVAQAADRFVCIADDSKYVARLGTFPLPVEVAPMARSAVARELLRLGGKPQLRLNFLTESGHEILDTVGLNLDRPVTMEELLNLIPGVMENGLFARRPADVLVLGHDRGTEVITVSASAS